MNEQQVRAILAGVGAVIVDSHIVYTSGKHGSAYVNKDAIYPHTLAVSQLCYALAEHFSGRDVDAIIAPAVGGVILSTWTSDHLGRLEGREILALYADKEGDDFVIRRGYDKLVRKKRVLIVEDVLTTGGSVRKVLRTVRAAGGFVLGVGALCNRGGVTAADIGAIPELYALLNVKLDDWPEEDCPLCKRNVPINVDVGKGREFLAKKRGQ